MTYRDDRDALLHRVDALEGELERTRREAEQLRADNARLAQPPPEPVALVRASPEEPARSLVRVPRPTRRFWLAIAAGGASVLGWVTIAAIAGAAIWMLPVAAATAGIAGAAMFRYGPEAARVQTTLPFDHASLNRLVDEQRRAVVVKLDVRFDPLVSGSRRKAITAQLARAGMRPTWKDTVLTVSSRRLRSSTAVVSFAQRALGALGELTGVEIASVVTRAGS